MVSDDDAPEPNIILLKGLVQGCVNQSANLRFNNDFRPAKASILTREAEETGDELAGVWGTENPTTGTYRVALAFVTAVDQHLFSLDHLAETKFAYSREAVLRAAIEAAARAWWLLDPAIDARTRVARGLTERVYSLREMRKLLREITNEEKAPAEGSRLEVRIEELFTRAAAKDFEIIPDDRGRPTHVGERRPTATSLIDDYFAGGGPGLSGAFLYRLLSAQTHATLYGLLQNLRETEIEALGFKLELEADTRIGSIEARPLQREMALIVSIMTHRYVTTRLVEISAWPADAWKSWSLHTAKRAIDVLKTRA